MAHGTHFSWDESFRMGGTIENIHDLVEYPR
jgi:hypothetical protein